jgi:hypothetical protein
MGYAVASCGRCCVDLAADGAREDHRLGRVVGIERSLPTLTKADGTLLAAEAAESSDIVA